MPVTGRDQRQLRQIEPSTFEDERGRISTYIPDDPLVEYNLITYRAGSVRGLHWHPHFTEYTLFVSGSGYMRSRDIDGGRVTITDIRPGLSVKADPGIAHSVHATTDMIAVAMLTHRWDDSDPPLVRFEDFA